MMDTDFIPTRLCCGEKHLGPQCPDGKVMCILCFQLVELDMLSTDEETGQKCDVCEICEKIEKERCANSIPVPI